MEITNHTTPTTAIGIAYFLPITTFTVGTTSPQKIPAAAIGGIANAKPIPQPNMRTTVIIPKFFFNNVIKLSI